MATAIQVPDLALSEGTAERPPLLLLSVVCLGVVGWYLSVFSFLAGWVVGSLTLAAVGEWTVDVLQALTADMFVSGATAAFSYLCLVGAVLASLRHAPGLPRLHAALAFALAIGLDRIGNEASATPGDPFAVLVEYEWVWISICFVITLALAGWVKTGASTSANEPRDRGQDAPHPLGLEV